MLEAVISDAVAQRTREFGVRMARGASASDVGSLVLKHAALLVTIGLAVGLFAAFAHTRLMAALLYGVEPSDPVTFGGSRCCWRSLRWSPAWCRSCAPRVDPLDALRME